MKAQLKMRDVAAQIDVVDPIDNRPVQATGQPRFQELCQETVFLGVIVRAAAEGGNFVLEIAVLRVLFRLRRYENVRLRTLAWLSGWRR